jgi:hypothetical protein
MKQLMFFVLFILFSVSMGQDMGQTDWSGGPGQQGPYYWFDNEFWTSEFIDYSTQGSITLVQETSQRDFPDTGALVSSLVWIPMGTDWEIEWGNIEWISIEPDSTSISFQLRTGMAPGSMSEWSDPITESGTFLGAILPDTVLLLQYKAILCTTDPGVTPELEEVLIWGWYPGGIEEGQSTELNSEILEVISNPASELNISIHAFEPGYFSLQLFDVSGRLHEEIVDGYLDAGDYSFRLDDLEDGVYIAKLDTPGNVVIEKVTILNLR